MNNTFHRLRRTGATILLALSLAACGVPGSGGSGDPTPASGSPAPAPRPTVGARRPTATPVAAQPGAPALNPVLGFEPQAGGPGTPVALWGSGVAPNAPIVIRLGFPAPTGEVLASATADADGRWEASLVIPENLPSGERITRAFNLVAMDAANQPLASAPFGFVVGAEAPAEPADPAGPTLEGASQAVRELLTAWSNGGDVRPFLADNLIAELDAGRPADQVLGLHPIAFGEWTVGAPLDRPSEVLFVPATLHYEGFTEERVFTLVVDAGQWRINGGSLESSAPVESTLKYFWPVGAPVDLTVQPFKSKVVGEGWLIHMAVPHATTPDVVISGDLIGEAPGEKLDDVTVRGLPAVTYAFEGGSAVVWQEDNHTYLVSGTRPLPVLLEIANGLEETDRATWEQRVQPQ